MTRWLAACLLLVAWGPAVSGGDVFAHPATPAQLLELVGPSARTLAAQPVLAGTFAQRKFLRELPTPLRSDGDFVFSKELGVVWHTVRPFDSELVLTREGMTQRAQGAQTARVDAAQQPAVRVSVELFFALFALDVDRLAADFELFATKAGEGWQLGLRPRPGAALAAAFSSVVIDGAQRMTRVELVEANGDRSEIDLLTMDRLPHLTDEQRRQLSG
ncbi:MAG TPA: outer membrane lipoprotein carrier protein LolA [Nevskiaceae bacterium]|nr:outer membrane lipoprotein carrier protein LolA [Nevskiaceae bacterium]